MEIPFSTEMNIKWISVIEGLPLDKYKSDPRNFGIITDVLVLIHDETDPNEEPEIVQIYFLLDNDGTEKWAWAGGEDYPECHAGNIKYWAETPRYSHKSVPTKKELGWP